MLKAKYELLRLNKAEVLTFEVLPYSGKKRLSDKIIHEKALATNQIKKANPYEIENVLGTSDGKEEFFEFAGPQTDFIALINGIVKNCQKSDYTALCKYKLIVEAKPENFHLVNSDLLEMIEESFSLNKILAPPNQNILFIGQFEPEFVCSLARYNTIYVWHDSEINKYDYKFKYLNEKINYLNGDFNEVMEMLKDTLGDKELIIIANPPYGKIGAEITKAIIDNNLDFKEYINLLPINDYTEVRGLCNFIIPGSVKILPRGIFKKEDGKDLAVTPAVCKISKHIVNNSGLPELAVIGKETGNLEKYFLYNVKNGVPYCGYSQYDLEIIAGNCNPNTLLCLGRRDIAHGYLPYSINRDYEFNYGKITLQELLNKITHIYNYKKLQTIWGSDIYTFNTEVERNNFRDFMYSETGFKFYAKVFTAAKEDSTGGRFYVFPKIDWTRSWTLEEILKEYKYTDDEIKEILKDLEQYSTDWEKFKANKIFYENK